jgi:hypothetical protein
MAATTPPTITAAPTAPQRGEKATFSTRLDAFVTWLTGAAAQFADMATNVYNNAVDAFASATAAATCATNAATSESNALASANAAAVNAGATLWASGQTVAQDAAKISPLDRRTYRRKTATGAGTTDPAIDPTNYVLLSAGTGYTTLHVREEYASGTASLSGSGTNLTITRVLNTTKANTIPGASVAGNQITLPAGQYDFGGNAPAQTSSGQQRAYLYCVTDAAVVALGASGNGSGNCFVNGEFTSASTKLYELRNYINGNGNSFVYFLGAGSTNQAGQPEVYADITIRKLA